MQNKNKTNKRISPQMIALIGTIVIMIGGFFLSYNYVQEKKNHAFEYVRNVFYEQNQDIIVEEDKKETEEEDLGPVTNDYIGYLNIPKINVNKGFLDMRSSENDVDKNIYVVEGSNYPNVNKGNFIVAGHSGPGWNGFFDDLYKVQENDIVEVSFKGKKYTYQVVNIYKQPKTGTVAIYRNYDKTTLTLITCTNHDKYTQTIYIAELVKTE